MSEQTESLPSIGFDAEYTEALFRRSVRRYMLRRVGWQYGLVVFVFAPLWALFLARRAPQDLFQDPLSAWIFPLIAGMLVGVGYFIYQYRKCLSCSLTNFRKLAPPRVSFTITDDEFALTHPIAASRVTWTALNYLEIWRYSDMWMLFFSKHSWQILPADALDEEARQFITSQIRAHDGKVR